MTRTARVDNELLERILNRQHHVIGRNQALACGLTPPALMHRLRAGGPWRKLLPGVYVAVTGAVTNDQREMAALLHAGPRSVITGTVAVRRNGIRVPGSNVVDVLVPADVRCHGTGFVRVQRTARALTILRDVRAVVSEAVQRGLCTIAALHVELRMALTEVSDGIRSVAEAEFRVLLKRARLPMPIFNARLFDGDTLIAVVDCWWPDAGVAAEVDSREYHFFAADWQRTTLRHDQLTARGILLLHFPPQRIRNDPQGIVAELRLALEAGRRRPPLPIKAFRS